MDGRKGPEGEEISRLLNLRQALQQFGLSDYHIYGAVKRGEIEALQVGGKGRVYYSERQLRELKARVTRDYHLAA